MSDEPVKYVCPNCRELFVPKRSAQKYCSRSCSFYSLRSGESADLYDEIVEERGYRIFD